MSILTTRFAAGMVALSLAVSAAAPASANLPLNVQLVIDAIDQRIIDLGDDIADLNALLPGQTPQQRILTRRNIRQFQIRIRQLTSLRRVVPRFNQLRLEQIDSYFTLNVSFH